MKTILPETLEEKKTYILEYNESETEIEALPDIKPYHVKRTARHDYQLITIIKIELPFYVVQTHFGQNAIIRLGDNLAIYEPSKEFLTALKKEKRYRNCC